MKNKLLFIDDELDILKAYEAIFTSQKETVLNDLMGDFLDEAPVLDVELDRSYDVYKEMNFDIHVARQGQEGVDLFEKALDDEPFKVVFIDMRMPPGISGGETAKLIRSLCPNVEIVIVTAYSDSNIGALSSKVGGVDKLLYLKKPFEPDEIKQLALCLSTKYDNNRFKDDFISNVSHELYTPLSSIIGFSDLLNTDEDLPQKYGKFIEIINSCSHSMKSIVDDLLSFTKVKVGETPLKRSLVKINQILERVETAFKVKAQSRGIDFVVNTLTEERCLLIDEEKIFQSIYNLTDNAFKFTRPGGVVAVDVNLMEGKLILSVSDSGIGMDREQVETITSECLSKSSVDSKHLGVGLNIVKNYVQLHEGSILLDATLNYGSSFLLEIPVREVL